MPDLYAFEAGIRPIALNRKMNGVDTHARLSAALTVIVKGHKQGQIDDLLSWNYTVTV